MNGIPDEYNMMHANINKTYGMTSDEFCVAFDVFLALPLSEQLAILP